jgi:hypothetical protein
MNKSLLLAAAASGLLIVSVTVASTAVFTRAATPAPATAFPGLTTIYVGSGVYDDGGAANAGTATSIHCSNVSGVQVDVRGLVLDPLGAPIGAPGTETLAHGATVTFSTHSVDSFFDNHSFGTGALNKGVVNIEATNSGVFCTAMIINGAGNNVDGVQLHLVRVNPHPGTVE